MKFAFCLEMLYTELPFRLRLDAAKRHGIKQIEIWDWRDKDIPVLAKKLKSLGISVLNMSGNRNFGMLEIAGQDSFLAELTETAGIAKQLDCPRLMLLAQSLLPDGRGKPLATALSRAQIIDNSIACLETCVGLLNDSDLEIVIEPLNDVKDHPGFLLHSSEMVIEIIKGFSHPRVKLLYDVYHAAMMGEDVLSVLEKKIDFIGHIHIADLPGRHEPGSGELELLNILKLLDNLDFHYPVGFEFSPSDGNSERAMAKTMEFIEKC